MSTRGCLTSLLAIGLALVLVWVVIPQPAQGSTASAAAGPLTLRIGAPEPPTLDPITADYKQMVVVNQLFAGLTRTDEETGQVLPDLASSWEASPDCSVYTFTLRSGVRWSDGTALTAQHVRDGILRSLSPEVDAPQSYILHVIRNAAAYESGSAIDPDQVGIEVIDSTHIRFDLEQAAAFFPNTVSAPVARPVPTWAIAQWGDAWTDPAHIVTSGPYHLTDRVPNALMWLAKSASYWNAAAVQIEQVYIRIADAQTLWELYLRGMLDTVDVPADYLDTVRHDPVLSAQLHVEPDLCTYYYGFNTSQAPFDDVRVRQAFSAAVDRQGLIDDVLGGVQRPALTFTPPGVFGHVDGYAKGIGLPYDPAGAAALLAAAGYPGGAEFPPVTLWFNDSEGHQAIAEYVRDCWQTHLGATVNLASLPWEEYLEQVNAGNLPVFRLGWCADYADAYNFLYDGIVAEAGGFGSWPDAEYDLALSTAARTNDPVTRYSLYQQAEEILVESEAVLLPLYYYSWAVLNRPHLQRTYGVTGSAYLASWRLVYS